MTKARPEGRLRLALLLQTCSMCMYTVNAGNLALAQPSRSSSVFSECYSERAVDGNPYSKPMSSTVIGRCIHCVHSLFETNPWWRVDLGKSYIVDQVHVFGRSDCCQDRLHGGVIRVGNSLLIDNGNNNGICAVIGPDDAKKVFKCSKGLRGRYVSIHLPGKAKSLELCEVIVNRNPTENIALGKVTAQSTTLVYSFNPESSKAVDGNGDLQFEKKSCTHTTPSLNPWWRVDFGTSKPVSEVFIVNRAHYFHRLSNFEIRIGNNLLNNGNSNPKCGDTLYSMAGLPKASFYCKPRKTGRYLNIQIIGSSSVLSLCEVEVYSESKASLKDKPQSPTILDVYGQSSSTISLTCPESVGYPVPYVAWVQDGVVLQNSTTNTSVLNVNTSALTVRRNVTVLECIVSNIHGSDYHQFIFEGHYRICAKYEDMLVNRRSIHNRAPNVNEASSDTSVDKAVWFRLRDSGTMASMQIPNSCVSPWQCSTQATGWMLGSHPQIEDGVVKRTVCFSWDGDCCRYNTSILVRHCYGYYIYKFQGSLTSDVNAGYCAGNSQTKDPETLFTSVKPNDGESHSLQDHVMFIEKDLMMHECVIVCLSDVICKSINYDPNTRLCETNNATKATANPLAWTPRPGIQYYEKLDLIV